MVNVIPGAHYLPGNGALITAGASILLLGAPLAHLAADVYTQLRAGENPMALLDAHFADSTSEQDVVVLIHTPLTTSVVLRGANASVELVTESSTVTSFPALSRGWRGGAATKVVSWAASVGRPLPDAAGVALVLVEGCAPAIRAASSASLVRRLAPACSRPVQTPVNLPAAAAPPAPAADLDMTILDAPVPASSAAPPPGSLVPPKHDALAPTPPPPQSAPALPVAATEPVPQLASNQGHMVPVAPSVVVGRNPRADHSPHGQRTSLLQLYSANGEISRSHLVVTTEAGRVLVWDCGSANGTTVLRGGRIPEPLQPMVVALIQHGDLIDLGDGAQVWLA